MKMCSSSQTSAKAEKNMKRIMYTRRNCGKQGITGWFAYAGRSLLKRRQSMAKNVR